MIASKMYTKSLGLCFLVATVVASCALPGSAMGTLRIRGTFVESPSRGSTIIITLPAMYGLGSSDRILGDAGMFGHEDRTWRLEADENGVFSVASIDTVYHATICILPPLGAFPKHPPLPFYLIRFPQNDREVYVVEPLEGKPVYRVLDYGSKTEIPRSRAQWILLDLSYGLIDDGRGWLLTFSVARNAQTRMQTDGSRANSPSGSGSQPLFWNLNDDH